jgi:hypothetical protein
LQANDPEDLSHALVVPVGDVAALEKQVAGLTAELRLGALATNHRAYVEAYFSPEVCYGKVERLYRELPDKGVVV